MGVLLKIDPLLVDNTVYLKGIFSYCLLDRASFLLVTWWLVLCAKERIGYYGKKEVQK